MHKNSKHILIIAPENGIYQGDVKNLKVKKSRFRKMIINAPNKKCTRKHWMMISNTPDGQHCYWRK